MAGFQHQGLCYHPLMQLPTYVVWLSAAGILFLAAGLRNIFAPGFLSISPAHPGGTLPIAVGVFFVGLAVVQSRRPARRS